MATKEGANHVIHMHSPESFLSHKQTVMHNSQFIFEMCGAAPICYTVFWEEERTKHVLECLLKLGLQKDWTTSYPEVAVEVFHRREK